MSIKLDHVTYIYDHAAASPTMATDDVTLEIPDGQFIGLIGHTGSGKSTLIQFLNGLLQPTEGHVYYNDKDVWEEGFSKQLLRQKVGLVFQYPEHQLFEADVYTDVCFGPKNLGLSKEEIDARAKKALELVGLAENSYTKSPFDLSGGQKRRVAIAGVLAMEPEILVLDEPTAGLDPRGRDEILGVVSELQKKRGITIVLVSHSMEDVAEYADRLIVMAGGKVRFDDTPRNVFKQYKSLEAMGLSAPQITYLAQALKEKGFPINTDVMTVEEAKLEILRILKEK